MSHVLMVYAPSGKQVVCQSTLIDLLYEFKEEPLVFDLDDDGPAPEFSTRLAYKVKAYLDGKLVSTIITDAVTHYLENDPNIVVDRAQIGRHKGQYWIES